jgi:hypothetical protein
MLSRILKEFQDSGNIISLNDLSRRLGVDRSALDGMLETLVHLGKLREVCTLESSGNCHCAGCQGCSRPHGGIELKHNIEKEMKDASILRKVSY